MDNSYYLGIWVLLYRLLDILRVDDPSPRCIYSYNYCSSSFRDIYHCLLYTSSDEERFETSALAKRYVNMASIAERINTLEGDSSSFFDF